MRVISRKSGYERALIERVDEASADRVEPDCPYVATCGGCPLMPLRYAAQLGAKEGMVERLLLAAGVPLSGAGHRPALASERRSHFRHKAVYPVKVRAGRMVAGFYRPHSHELVNVDRCLVHTRRIERVHAKVLRKLWDRPLPVYQESSGRGTLRFLAYRESRQTRAVLVGLVTAHPIAAGWGAYLLDADPAIEGVVNNIQPQRGNAVMGEREIRLAGKPCIAERLGPARFELSLSGFSQVHPDMADRLYDQIVSEALGRGVRRAIDAYAGAGALAFALAAAGIPATAIESHPLAGASFRRAEEINAIEGVALRPGRVEDELGALLRVGDVDLLVFDPPRRGLDPRVIKAALHAPPPHLAYASCEPQTFARDLALLTRGGYRLAWWRILDMFPHTDRVEVLGWLERPAR